MQSGRSHDKADVISTTTTSAPSHLLKLRRGEWAPTASGSRISASQHDGARWKIHTGGDCRGGKDRVEQPGTHQLFDHEFPGWNVSRVMRRNSAANNRVPVTMPTHFRILLDKRAHKVATCFTTTIVR